MENEKRSLTMLMTFVTIGVLVTIVKADIQIHWKLDRSRGLTEIDSSGNDHQGDLKGGLSFEADSVTGVVGEALQFDGIDDGIVGMSFHIPTDAFTISMWFKPEMSLSSVSKEMVLLSWYKPPGVGAPSFIFNSNNQGRLTFYFETRCTPPHKQLVTTTNSWQSGTWYHIAVSYDGREYKLFVNGGLEDKCECVGSHYGSYGLYLGTSSQGGFPFKGIIDDFRMYGNALDAETIKKMSAPTLLRFSELVHKAKEMLRDNQPQKAIAFIENKRVSGELKKKGFSEFVPGEKALYFELYFLLAKAKEQAGFSKAEIIKACKRALELSGLTVSKSVSVLMRLNKNMDEEQYKAFARELMLKSPGFFKVLAAQTGAMLSTETSQNVTRFLEESLAIYLRWKRNHYDERLACEESLPAFYYVLARARRAAGAPKNEIAQAYIKSFTPEKDKFMNEKVNSMIWLFDNGYDERTKPIISSFMKKKDLGEQFIESIATKSERSNKWTLFEQFLNVLFQEVQNPGEWALFVEAFFEVPTSRWAEAYLNYLRSKPKVKFARDMRVAAAYLKDGQYQKAADLYRNLLQKPFSRENQAELKFNLCRCLFYGPGYEQAGPLLEGFVSEYQDSHHALAAKATLLRARGFVQLEKPEKALQLYTILLKQNHDKEIIPEVKFYIGYCYLLQRELKAAQQSFKALLEGYPDSSFASKAQLCLKKIKMFSD